MDLSRRRAAAVVAALATRYSVGKDRMTPVELVENAVAACKYDGEGAWPCAGLRP